jgi:hypothetical protein
MNVGAGLGKDWLTEGEITAEVSWAVVLTPPGSAGAVRTVGIANAIIKSRVINAILQRECHFSREACERRVPRRHTQTRFYLNPAVQNKIGDFMSRRNSNGTVLNLCRHRQMIVTFPKEGRATMIE